MTSLAGWGCAKLLHCRFCSTPPRPEPWPGKEQAMSNEYLALLILSILFILPLLYNL